MLQAAQTCLEDVIQYLDELVAADIEAASVGEAEAADGAGRVGPGGEPAAGRFDHRAALAQQPGPRPQEPRRLPTPEQGDEWQRAAEVWQRPVLQH